MSAPPGWPKLYAAVVRKLFRPNAESRAKGFEPAEVGDEVQCTSLINDRKQVKILFPRRQNGSRGREGWIDTSFIEISRTSKVGDRLKIHLDTPWVPALEAAGQTEVRNDHNDRLHRTIHGLLCSYAQNREAFPTEPIYSARYIGTEKLRNSFRDEMIAGIRLAGGNNLYNALNGDFTLQQLKTLCKVVNDADRKGKFYNQGGIYIIAVDRSGLYTGSTAPGFGVRWHEGRGHKSKIEENSQSGLLYRCCNAGQSYAMYGICFIVGGQADWQGEKQRIMEQVFVDMLQTASGVVRNMNSVDNVPESATLNPSGGTNESVNAETMARGLRYAGDKQNATILKKHADAVFQLTGWPGAVDRRSFGMTVPDAGLNWKSPLFERTFGKMQWTKVEVRGHFAEFRRSVNLMRTAAQDHVRLIEIVHKHNPLVANPPSGGVFSLSVHRDEPGIPDVVDFVVIVKLDGQPAARPFGRQPTVGPFSNISEANEVECRIEWPVENTNQTKSRSLQLDEVMTAYKGGNDALPEFSRGYTQATALRAYLLQEHHLQTPDLSCLINFGIARIKEIKVDHLTQSIVSSVLHNPHNRAKPITRVSRRDQAQKLIALGADFVAKPGDKIFPPYKAPPYNLSGTKTTVGAGSQQKKCSLCKHMLNHHEWHCDRVGQTNTCDACAKLDRPCTFNHDQTLQRKPALRAAVAMVPAINPRNHQTVVNHTILKF